MPRDNWKYPVIPHEAVENTDCCGCPTVRERGDQADVRCNECGAVLPTVPLAEAAAAIAAMMPNEASGMRTFGWSRRQSGQEYLSDEALAARNGCVKRPECLDQLGGWWKGYSHPGESLWAD
jgi:hypothetical protein